MIAPFVIWLVVFLLVRKIVWWYFGIDRALRALEALAYGSSSRQAAREHID